MSKKLNAAMVIVGFLTASFTSYLFWRLNENIIEAMKSVVDADAALIGFLAVATVFLLTQTSAEHRRVLDKITSLEKQHRLNIERNLSDDLEYSNYKKEQLQLTRFATFNSTFSNFAVSASLVSATFFVVSILMALLGMSNDILAKDIGVSVRSLEWLWG
jgi:hypothetical protein